MGFSFGNDEYNDLVPWRKERTRRRRLKRMGWEAENLSPTSNSWGAELT